MLKSKVLKSLLKSEASVSSCLLSTLHTFQSTRSGILRIPGLAKASLQLQNTEVYAHGKFVYRFIHKVSIFFLANPWRNLLNIDHAIT